MLIAALIGYFLAACFDVMGFDFDEVMMMAMGFAGLAYVIADLKRERKLEAHALSFESRLATVEAKVPENTEARLTSVEAEVPENLTARLLTLESLALPNLAERMVAVEAAFHNLSKEAPMLERLATLETRLRSFEEGAGGQDV